MHNVLTLNEQTPLDGIFAATAACPTGIVQTFVVHKAATSLQGGFNLVDRQGHAFASYLVDVGEETAIVVLRPDGFIGAIVVDDAGSTRYFNNIFTQSV
ncbi:hypothetical protein B0H19DRAFT_1171930 [Mycena capillaripes]|nr:hypothetical protein B0H19DRAFT_1171930 [Mycena capillaripes]